MFRFGSIRVMAHIITNVYKRWWIWTLTASLIVGIMISDSSFNFTTSFIIKSIYYRKRKWASDQTYLPVFVIIISVPSSWNLSHNSFVSKWHCTGFNSSQLHDPNNPGRCCCKEWKSCLRYYTNWRYSVNNAPVPVQAIVDHHHKDWMATFVNFARF